MQQDLGRKLNIRELRAHKGHRQKQHRERGNFIHELLLNKITIIVYYHSYHTNCFFF